MTLNGTRCTERYKEKEIKKQKWEVSKTEFSAPKYVTWAKKPESSSSLTSPNIKI